MANSTSRTSQLASPVGDAFGFPIKGEIGISSHVATLLFRKGPMAVLGRVITVIILSFNGVPRGRPGAHIFKKGGKNVPSLTNLNPSPSMVFEFGKVGIIASGAHRMPMAILRCLANSFRFVGSPYPAAAAASALTAFNIMLTANSFKSTGAASLNPVS